MISRALSTLSRITSDDLAACLLGSVAVYFMVMM